MRIKYDLALFTKLNQEYESKPLVPKPRTFDAPARKSEASDRVKRLVGFHAKVSKTGLKGKRVLEIGCGRGNTAHELATTLGCEVVGVDISEYPTWNEYKAPNVNLQKIDISIENYDHLGKFDFIYSHAVWEHILHPFAALRAAYHLLQPSTDGREGGAMYLNANLYRGPKASHRYREIYFPWPHLLFRDEVFEEYYKKIGRPPARAAWVNKLVSAEYLLYFQQMNFRTKQIWYSETAIDEDFYTRFHDILGRYPRFDLEKDFIHALLTV